MAIPEVGGVYQVCARPLAVYPPLSVSLIQELDNARVRIQNQGVPA